MGAKITATGLIVLIALLSYQAGPVTGTIGWVVVTLLALSLIVSMTKGK